MPNISISGHPAGTAAVTPLAQTAAKPGLLSGLLGGGGLGGGLGKIMTLAREHPELFLSMGAGFLGGQNGADSMRGGFGNAAQVAQIIREQRKAEQQKSLTMDWLKQNAPEFIKPIEAGLISPTDAYKAKTGMGQSQSRYGNPQPFQKPDGSISYGMFGSDGTFKEIQTPEGWQPAPTMEKVDAGDHWEVYDKRTGQLMNIVPKKTFEESEAKARGAEVGKGRGEAQAKYESMVSKLPGLKQVVNQLYDLADKATYTMGGKLVDEVIKQTGQVPREAAVARSRYMAMVDNQILPLLRDTFGAQFTVREGETLRATLGDPDKTPAEKKAVLEAFIQQKIRDIEGLATQAGSGSDSMTVPDQAPADGGAVKSWKDYF